MKKEIADKWAENLRSDKYKRTTGRLRRANAFCCLGVLCDMYIKETKLAQWSKNKKYKNVIFNDKSQGEALDVLTIPIMDWSGIKTKAGDLSLDGTAICLAELNDAGKSFAEIADIIEENWDQL